MSRFIQLHALTCYPPSNPNRDDLGRPKTAQYGETTRLRVSSQAIKRSIRTHPVFQEHMAGFFATRTKRLGTDILLAALGSIDGSDKAALEIAETIVKAVANLDIGKGKPPALADQLVFMTGREIERAEDCARSIANGSLKLPKKPEEAAKLITETIFEEAPTAVDLALFGRMLTGTGNFASRFSRDAACQVAHAITTHRAQIEDDYFTALDDLATNQASAHVDEAGFSAGVFYVYACINCDLLIENLAGDAALARRAIEAFVEAFALASPSGKKNSFANHVRAEFLLCERGDGQPRSLASAFLRPVRARSEDDDLMTASIRALGVRRAAFVDAYGRDWTDDLHMNARAADLRPDDAFAEGGATLQAAARFAANAAQAGTV